MSARGYAIGATRTSFAVFPTLSAGKPDQLRACRVPSGQS